MDDLDGAITQLLNACQRTIGSGAPGSGTGFQQLLDGDIPLSPALRARLARRISGLAEEVRIARGYAHKDFPVNPEERPLWPQPAASGGAPDERRIALPINRKERYYTGTVLPAILATDRFMHLDLFLRRCGLEVDTLEVGTLEVLTEYNLVESARTDDEKRRFRTPGLLGDTPDVILAGEDWLVVVEAKMFHSPSPADMSAQLAAQRPVVERLQRGLGIHDDRTRHGFLTPEGLQTPTDGDFVITWQQVLADYEAIASPYWCEALRRALDGYHGLASQPTSNAHAYVIGAELAAQYASGTCRWTHVGRQGGADGARFVGDVATGGWESVRYQVREAPADANNPNWMPVEKWAQAVGITA